MSISQNGVVYTETIIYSPPEQYAADAPYQLAIVDLDSGGRLTARILGKEATDRVRIGDRVIFVEERNGAAYYRKDDAETPDEPSQTARPLV